MFIQDLSSINETLDLWTLVGYLLIALIIVVLILYPIAKIMEMRSYRRHSSKPRVKGGKK